MIPRSQLQDYPSGPRSHPTSAEAGFHGLRQRPTLLLGQLLWTQSSEYSLDSIVRFITVDNISAPLQWCKKDPGYLSNRSIYSMIQPPVHPALRHQKKPLAGLPTIFGQNDWWVNGFVCKDWKRCQ